MAKIETLVDDFSGTLALWSPNRASIAIETGQAVLPIPTTAGQYFYQNMPSAATYDLAGSYIYGKFSLDATVIDKQYVAFSVVFPDHNNRVRMAMAYNNTLQLVVTTAGTDSATYLTYSPTSMAWWRIRESAGSFYFDTSPDGITWTNRRTTSHTFSAATLASSKALMVHGWDGATAPTTTLNFRVDNINTGGAAPTNAGRIGQATYIDSATYITKLSCPISSPTKDRILVSLIGIDKDSGGISAPDGWNLMATKVGASISQALAWRVATGAETSLTWNWATFRKAATTSVYQLPAGVSATVLQTLNPPYSDALVTSVSTGTTTAQTRDALAISTWTVDSDLDPSGPTTWDYYDEYPGAGGGAPSIALAFDALPAGATTSATWTTATSDQQSTMLLLLDAAPAVTVLPPKISVAGSVETIWNDPVEVTATVDNYDSLTWSIVSRPTGSTTNIISNGLNARFVPDKAGTYTYRLSATNAGGTTSKDFSTKVLAQLWRKGNVGKFPAKITRNRTIDGTFESQVVGAVPAGWEGLVGLPDAEGATYLIVQDGIDGSKAARMMVGSGSSRNARLRPTQNNACAPGQRIKFSVQAKTSDATNGYLHFSVRPFDFNGEPLPVIDTPQSKLAGIFGEHSYYWVVPEGIYSYRTGVMFGGSTTEVAVNATCTIDNYKTVLAPLSSQMRNVFGKKINATTGRITDSPPADTGGVPLIGIRRGRNDPNGDLNGDWSAIDPPESTYRDFLNLSPGIYTFTTSPITEHGEGPTVSTTVDLTGTGPVTQTRLSGIHWAEFKADSDEAAVWRNQPMSVIPVFTPQDTWDNITQFFMFTVDPYFGAQGTTTYQMPNVKQLNIFVPFVPTALSADYHQAFLDLRAGIYDTQWQKFGETLTKWQLPETINVIIGQEWNTNKFPNNGSGLAPIDWTSCYRRIVDQIRIGYSGATPPAGIEKKSLKFGMANSHGASPGIPGEFSPTDYFPGIDYCQYWGLNVFDVYEPVKDEASWTAKRSQVNSLDANNAFVDTVADLNFNIPRWGVWNAAFDASVDDLSTSHGGDNPFFIQKMFEWFSEVGISDESYFEYPTGEPHWISTARLQNNPNAGAKYVEMIAASKPVTYMYRQDWDGSNGTDVAGWRAEMSSGVQNTNSVVLDTSRDAGGGSTTGSLRWSGVDGTQLVEYNGTVDISPSTEYTYTCRVYNGDTVARNFRARIHQYDPNHAYITTNGTAGISVAAGTWQEITLTFTTTSIAGKIRPAMAVDNAVSTATYNIDRVRISKPGTVGPTVLISDDGSGTGTYSYSTDPAGGADQTFFLENSTASRFTRDAGFIKQVRDLANHDFRMWSKAAVGGPGNNLRIKARLRATEIRDDNPNANLTEGVKFLFKWVAPNHNGSQTDPSNARGIYPWWQDAGKTINASPGSMQYVPMTRTGYHEISKRFWGSNTYKFPVTETALTAYTIGEWIDFEITMEWIASPESLRITTYRNGVQHLQVTDTGYPEEPGGEVFSWACFPGIRADSSVFELDYFTVEPM